MWFRKNIVWLLVLFCMAVAGGFLVMRYEEALRNSQKKADEATRQFNYASDYIQQLETDLEILRTKLTEYEKPLPADDVASVYNPEAAQLSSQAKMDEMKKRYEDILVTYFTLHKCTDISPLDYHVIVSALAQDMASVNAPGRLQFEILTSAQGSYKELYSGNTCDAKTIDPLKEQFRSYIDSMTKEFMPR